MNYKTYAYLMDFLEREIYKRHAEYVTSLSFFANTSQKDKNKAYAYFQMEVGKISQMKKELKDAVKAFYKDHPNPKMKQFWGIE